jgi:hypothetical protein
MRERGLEFPEPLFVTDLVPVKLPRPSEQRPRQPPPSSAEIKERSAKAAKSLKRIPFLSNLVIVPEVPQTSRLAFSARVVIPRGISRKPFRYGWLLEENPFPEESLSLPEGLRQPDFSGREIKFTLSPRIDDPAWIVALLIALNLPRIQEILPKIVEREVNRELLTRGDLEGKSVQTKRAMEADFLRRVSNWAAFFGQPAPNEGWQNVLSQGTFPFFLVPWRIWNEFSSRASTRGLETVRGLAKVRSARP